MKVRTGWMLGDAALAFYPRTAIADDTVERARALLARDDLDSVLRRSVIDETDDLERRLAVMKEFSPA